MAFFEPLPPPPDPGDAQPTGWVPPAWDRPSEATVGAPVPLTAVLAQTDELAVVLTGVKAYRNGFTFELVFQRNPMVPRSVDEDPRGLMMMTMFGPPNMRGQGGPRLGIEFADGSRITDFGFQPLNSGEKDERGFPTRPILRLHGGGGGGHDRWSTSFWCYPLPPPGPMNVYLELQTRGIPETKTTVDAGPIIEAAQHVVVLWEPESPS